MRQALAGITPPAPDATISYELPLRDAWTGTKGTAEERVQALVNSASTSFFWAMRLLPEERRRAMFAVYAFCRVVDDIADGDWPAEKKLAALSAWRAEIYRTFDGAPIHPVTIVVESYVARFNLRIEDFLAVIDGMEMDSSGHMVAPSLRELELYCRRVAGAVGLLATSIFGLRRDEGRALALPLGQALQLTNVLRDLLEDAAEGRLYLAREMLERHDIESREPAVVLAHPNLPHLCTEMVEMAEENFALAIRALKCCPRIPVRPARIMMRVYHQLLQRLKKRGFARENLAQPVRLGRLERLSIALAEFAADGFMMKRWERI